MGNNDIETIIVILEVLGISDLKLRILIDPIFECEPAGSLYQGRTYVHTHHFTLKIGSSG